jgi:hypothetical protein
MQSNWLTLVSNTPNHDVAYKEYFGGSQWSPTNETWSLMSYVSNGASTLLTTPNVGVRLFSMSAAFTPGLNVRTPTLNWGGFGSLGGVGSW